VMEDVETALTLADDRMAAQLGRLFRIVRRARAAGLDEPAVAALHLRLVREVARERERSGAPLVISLEEETGRPDRALVGGKAAGLFTARRLLPAGARIPRGFVVTTAAYRLHLLGETGDRLQEAAATARDEAEASRRARAALLGSPLPDEVADAVDRAASALGAPRLAVRSSATIEDGALGSLAGQFDSWLGVRPGGELRERVRQAWASLWNARAVRTLAAAGRSPLGAAQAVLVQEVVSTRAAGVLLSRDPGGRPGVLLVNAAWGLGEAISRGEVAGDLSWVERATGRLLAFEPGAGRVALALDPDRPGTVEVALPEKQADRPCLDAADLARLAELARAIEEATGRDQDVEFGFDDAGALVVFQVRRVVRPR